jgi:hypothetical protein
MSTDNKIINIVGQNNRYQMKKVTRIDKDKPIKKTIVSTFWKFDTKYLNNNIQYKLINQILKQKINEETKDVIKIIIQQINKKIQSYKQQDIKKKNYSEENENYKDFIDFNIIIYEMDKCNLKCHYCCQSMLVLYENVREGCQWTVDRINNDFGHIKSNFNLVCLKCNLKRRCQSDNKYLFTSQLSIKKLN